MATMGAIGSWRPARVTSAGLAMLAAIGCSKTFTVRPVDPARVPYAATDRPGPAAFSVTDARTDKTLNTGTLTVRLRGLDGAEVAFFASNLVAVLKARGIDVRSDDGAADAVLQIRSYSYRNLRTSGFSPYHTFASFSADLRAQGRTHRLVAFFKNSKVPVWAFSEVERPCYQITTDVLVNEIAAKMNRHLFGRVASDETVEQLAALVGSGRTDASGEGYLTVLALGYTNNPAAAPRLVPLTTHEDTMMRAAALSALGTLGASDQLSLLVKAYESNQGLPKVMAAKAIGDLDTPESASVLERIQQSKVDNDDRLQDVVALYR